MMAVGHDRATALDRATFRDVPAGWQAPNDVAAVMAGRYELGPVLGGGGSAEVYRAHDHALGREVAVKVFGRGVSGPDQQRQEHELQALARMHHPGLVELYDAGTQDGRAFLVMELVDGPTLGQYLGGRAQAPVRAAQLGRDLADALAYVHAHRVTHRDVKPGNILLGGDDRPMLSDFGIALLVETTRVTATGSVIGTPAYMAPEQIRGQDVGPAVDVYALGLIVLEALTGQQEFPGAPTEAALARLHRDPGVPALPAGLTPLLQRMTDARPESRPTAVEVADTLDAATAELHGGPVGVPGQIPTRARTALAAPVGAPLSERSAGITPVSPPRRTGAVPGPVRPAPAPGGPRSTVAAGGRRRGGRKLASAVAVCAALGLGLAAWSLPDMATGPAPAPAVPVAPPVLATPLPEDPARVNPDADGDGIPDAAGNGTEPNNSNGTGGGDGNSSGSGSGGSSSNGRQGSGNGEGQAAPPPALQKEPENSAAAEPPTEQEAPGSGAAADPSTTAPEATTSTNEP